MLRKTYLSQQMILWNHLFQHDDLHFLLLIMRLS